MIVSTVSAAVAIAACGSGTAAPHPAATSTTSASAFVAPPAGIAAVQLFGPMGRYTEYVTAELSRLRTQLAALNGAITAGDLARSKQEWLTAHLTWLAIGQDDGAYGAFGALGGAIDGTADGDVGGTRSPSFTGFHKVELDLFHDHDLPAAHRDAAKLTSLVDSITEQTLNQDLALTATSLDSWVLRCHEILEDALRDSLSQDDDYGSGTDLADVGADVGATREMLDVLSPLIEPRAPGLVSRGTAELDSVAAAIAAVHRPGSAWREPSALPLRSRQRIDAALDAALETLAPVSELMRISNANS
jgi:iron uptake system EfeUOB component EfeO/EfeM